MTTGSRSAQGVEWSGEEVARSLDKRLPVWYRVGIVVVAVVVSADVWAKRGMVFGLVGVVLWGFLAADMFFPARLTSWSRRRRLLGSVVGGVFVGLMGFLALALITNWSGLLCGVGGAVAMVAMAMAEFIARIVRRA